MKHIKFLMIYTVAICVIFLPQGQAPMASSTLLNTGYMAYPKPLQKPLECTYKDSINHENFDKKQAAAIALGLYLGMKKATAPETIKVQKQTLCV